MPYAGALGEALGLHLPSGASNTSAPREAAAEAPSPLRAERVHRERALHRTGYVCLAPRSEVPRAKARHTTKWRCVCVCGLGGATTSGGAREIRRGDERAAGCRRRDGDEETKRGAGDKTSNGAGARCLPSADDAVAGGEIGAGLHSVKLWPTAREAGGTAERPEAGRPDAHGPVTTPRCPASPACVVWPESCGGSPAR